MIAFRSRNPNSRKVHFAPNAFISYSLCELWRPWVSGDIRPTDYLCPRCVAEAKRRGLEYNNLLENGEGRKYEAPRTPFR